MKHEVDNVVQENMYMYYYFNTFLFESKHDAISIQPMRKDNIFCLNIISCFRFL